MKQDFAIIIGINDYTLPNDAGLKTLKGAVNDANEVEKWVSSITGGNVPVDNIKKIISAPDPLKPLQDEIDDAFLEIEKSIRKNGLGKRLYFYFAGHGVGTTNSANDTALCLANWSEYRRNSALSSESYKDSFKRYGYFEEIIFIIDCCRNTKIDIEPKHPTFSIPMSGEKSGETNLFVAYATQYQDQSYEIESIDSEMRGAFTTVLLEGLKGAAANNGLIGADDLRDYLKKETPKLAQNNGYKQIPEVYHSFTGNPSLHTVAQINSNVNIIFEPTRNYMVELLDGGLNVIATYDASQSKNSSVQLSKGLYLLRDTVTDEKKPFQVTLPNNDINVNF